MLKRIHVCKRSAHVGINDGRANSTGFVQWASSGLGRAVRKALSEDSLTLDEMDGNVRGASESTLYQKLDHECQQIRVLHVESSTHEASVLKCRTEVIDLAKQDASQTYEAISYCWGNSRVRVAVEIDGHTLHVPLNTETVLRCICDLHGHRCVWIDAICINQEDVDERNHQVALMDRIYSQAERVLVWLGEMSPTAKQPLTALKALMVDVQENLGADWKVIIERGSPSWSPNAPLDVSGSDLWALWSSKWFTRLWVIQEIVLAREAEVFHNNESVPFSYLTAATWAAMSWVSDWHGRNMLEGPENASMINSLVISYRLFTTYDNFSLGRLMWQTQTYMTSEPRDKVFALLGLWRERSRARQLPLNVKVDYSRPVAEIYSGAMKVAIVDQGNLDSLLATGETVINTSSAFGELPSWVPSPYVYSWYMRPFQMSADYLVDNGSNSVRRANDTIPLTTDLSNPQSSSLMLQGVVVDEVRHITPTNEKYPYTRRQEPGASLHFNLNAYIEYIAELFAWAKSLLPDREDEEIVHLLLNSWLGRDIDDAQHPLVPGYGKLFRKEVLELMEDFSTGRSKLECKLVVGRPRDEFTEASVRGSMQFTIFVTEDHRLGVGSRQVEPGDKVCILFGEGTPIILRPHKSYWTWVGPTYLHDLVDGSYIRYLRERGQLEAETQWIEIR